MNFADVNDVRRAAEEQAFVYFTDFLEECEGKCEQYLRCYWYEIRNKIYVHMSYAKANMFVLTVASAITLHISCRW